VLSQRIVVAAVSLNIEISKFLTNPSWRSHNGLERINATLPLIVAMA
jgi:hypothetical protein